MTLRKYRLVESGIRNDFVSAYQEKISHANDCQKTDIHRSTKGVVFKASFGQHNATQTNEFLQILAA
jgi:hypothetical protein